MNKIIYLITTYIKTHKHSKPPFHDKLELKRKGWREKTLSLNIDTSKSTE